MSRYWTARKFSFQKWELFDREFFASFSVDDYIILQKGIALF